MAVTPRTVGPAPPPDASRPGKKVARFITAEAAQSTLNIADDGRLPELQLQESTQAKPGEAGGSTVHPLVLLGLVSLSVVASVLLVLYEPRQETLPRSTAKQDARDVIVSEYLADEEHLKLDNPPPLEPYQTYLREAQRAYWRGDYATERRLYRRVLDLLRAEGTDFDGVTGSPTSDRRLEEQITILLSDE